MEAVCFCAGVFDLAPGVDEKRSIGVSYNEPWAFGKGLGMLVMPIQALRPSLPTIAGVFVAAVTATHEIIAAVGVADGGLQIVVVA